MNSEEVREKLMQLIAEGSVKDVQQFLRDLYSQGHARGYEEGRKAAALCNH